MLGYMSEHRSYIASITHKAYRRWPKDGLSDTTDDWLSNIPALLPADRALYSVESPSGRDQTSAL